MIQQAFTFWSFHDKGVDDLALIKAAAKIGYAGVEFLPTELIAAAKDEGLAIVGTGGHGTIQRGFNDRAMHADLKDHVKANLEMAAKHGLSHLVVFAGNRQPGVSNDDAIAITAEGLRPLAPLAESAGVNLVLELLNSKIDHIGYQADSTVWAAKVVDAVNSPRVKLLYDVYHMQIMEGDLIRTIGRHAPQIGHYHTAGNPGRGMIDDRQEIFYPAVIQAIQASGYTGWIGHEIVPKGDPIAGLKQAYELVFTSWQ